MNCTFSISKHGKVFQHLKLLWSQCKTTHNFFLFLFSGNEREVEGTLSVQPQAIPVKGFKDYFLDLTPENNQRNPWFTGNVVYFTHT